jgi:hypothetical protein
MAVSEPVREGHPLVRPTLRPGEARLVPGPAFAQGPPSCEDY